MTYVQMIREIMDESYFFLNIHVRAKWHIPPWSMVTTCMGVWEKKCSLYAPWKIIEILDNL